MKDYNNCQNRNPFETNTPQSKKKGSEVVFDNKPGKLNFNANPFANTLVHCQIRIEIYKFF